MDVGQGDAILIRTPGGNDILIDGGPDRSVVDALGRNLPAADKTLELVVLTHPDLDHVGGLPAVASQYRIERVLETTVRSGSVANQQWESAIQRQGSKQYVAQQGQNFIFDEIHFFILWPAAQEDLSQLDRNETSVEILMTYKSKKWYFVGDAGEYVEERLAQQGLLTDVDVLKVGHHGSISATTEKFLDAVTPEMALISDGTGNPFGHPHPVVLRRLEKRGINIYRTDQLGDITLTSDGSSIKVIP